MSFNSTSPTQQHNPNVRHNQGLVVVVEVEDLVWNHCGIKYLAPGVPSDLRVSGTGRDIRGVNFGEPLCTRPYVRSPEWTIYINCRNIMRVWIYNMWLLKSVSVDFDGFVCWRFFDCEFWRVNCNAWTVVVFLIFIYRIWVIK